MGVLVGVEAAMPDIDTGLRGMGTHYTVDKIYRWIWMHRWGLEKGGRKGEARGDKKGYEGKGEGRNWDVTSGGNLGGGYGWCTHRGFDGWFYCGMATLKTWIVDLAGAGL
jgi:hypothetical protein